MDADDPEQHVRKIASEAGFDRCGIARAEPIGRAEYLRAWLAGGRAGSMEYLHRYSTIRMDPRELLPGAKSVIVVALVYRSQDDPPPSAVSEASACTGHTAASADTAPSPTGRVARYAWGDDYHKIVKAKLFAMADRMRAELGTEFECKACVDTAPLLEREWAAAAGIGWIGKNTMVLDAALGSYFFLGALVTTLDLTPDSPAQDHCGTCTACLDACPTGAFPAPYEMDASRCISYLTIEHRGDIPESLQPQMGEWVFGCDVCQEVCPHNRAAPETKEPRFANRPPGPRPALDEILAWTQEDYRQELRGSAIKRATLDMLKRNARIAKRNAQRG